MCLPMRYSLVPKGEPQRLNEQSQGIQVQSTVRYFVTVGQGSVTPNATLEIVLMVHEVLLLHWDEKYDVTIPVNSFAIWIQRQCYWCCKSCCPYECKLLRLWGRDRRLKTVFSYTPSDQNFSWCIGNFLFYRRLVVQPYRTFASRTLIVYRPLRVLHPPRVRSLGVLYTRFLSDSSDG